MKTVHITIIIILLLCIISSVVAYMMSSTDPEPELELEPEEYKYDFIINVPNHHANYNLHISDIKADDVRLTKEHVTIHVTPDNAICNSKPGSYECAEGATGMHDLHPITDNVNDITWTAWNKDTLPKDTKVFTVTMKNKVKKFEIEHWRPVYVPGFIIKENDVEVLKESENRGSETTPSPVVYTYSLY
jgi:hypothetical protein